MFKLFYIRGQLERDIRYPKRTLPGPVSIYHLLIVLMELISNYSSLWNFFLSCKVGRDWDDKDSVSKHLISKSNNILKCDFFLLSFWLPFSMLSVNLSFRKGSCSVTSCEHKLDSILTNIRTANISLLPWKVIAICCPVFWKMVRINTKTEGLGAWEGFIAFNCLPLGPVLSH